MNTKRYIYENVEILRIIDGDTIVVNIDLGFNIWKKATLRLYGINAPEIKGTEKELGLKSKEYVSSLIPINSYVKLECLGKDKYGRWLANIYKDELFINQHLIDLKYANIYKI
ncbi:MAG: thermonuclease family protein [Clostridium sp.]|nr:thermonuclease family protein [Clostridium sp.]